MRVGVAHLGAALAAARLCRAAFFYPSVQVSLLEHILVDNWGAYASNFSAAITPCSNYVTEVGLPALNSGRTTAAQWMRVAFHDFVTANVTAGTGGVDASIGFETLRAENSGSAVNDSFTFWRPYVNDVVPMADLVAIGTVMSVGLCGGKKIPFRPGRRDALAADPTTGVPAPETDLEGTLAFFNRAGFNPTDSIGLTACGHTMGSVHHGGFPDVVPETAVTENNTNGGANFDTTRAVFDPAVVHEYVDGTGNLGGPLVATDNVTTRSDLRLYESDNNATMKALYAQGAGFIDTCVDLFTRMINTVPKHVSLGSPIAAMPIKPINVTFDFGKGDSLELSGKIRVLTASGSTPPQYLEIKLSTGFSARLAPEAETGSSVFGEDTTVSPVAYGTTTYFGFALSPTGLERATSFNISGPGLRTESFAVQSGVFVVPSLSSVTGTTVNVTVAALPGTFSHGSVQIAAPLGQVGTLGPKIDTQALAVSKIRGLKSGYELWGGSAALATGPTGAVSVQATVKEAVDVLMLNGGAAGW